MPESVRCRDCGYLTCRDGLDLVEVYDVDGFRDGKSSSQLLCFVRQAEFAGDAKAVALPRQCSEYTEWTQGFSPKEHFEMNVMERLRASEKEQANLDREWRERQVARDLEWRERQAERDRKWRQEDQEAAAAAFKRERYKMLVVAAWVLAASCITWIIAILALK